MAKILVIGATGQQGGGVVDAALSAGHGVRAFVRDDSSDKALDLKERGVELAVGTLDDVESIVAAAEGVDAMFGVTTMYTGLDAEVQHGYNLVEAAERAGVAHVVYSSVASADRSTGIGHFDSKWEVEKRLAETDVPHSVVAPVFFADNYVFPWNLADMKDGKIRQAVDPDVPLQIVDPTDIGRTVVAMFEDPDRYIGQRVEIAGDELSGTELAAVLSEATGIDITYERQPDAEVQAMGEDMASMYRWFNDVGYSVDFDELSETMPEVGYKNLAGWASQKDWDSLLSA